MLVWKIVTGVTLIPIAIITCILLMLYIDKTIEVTHRRIGPRLRLHSRKKATLPPAQARADKAAGMPVAEPLSQAAPD
jgi:hypothetical protein